MEWIQNRTRSHQADIAERFANAITSEEQGATDFEEVFMAVSAEISLILGEMKAEQELVLVKLAELEEKTTPGHTLYRG